MLSSISVADVYMLMGAVSCRNCAFVNFTNISNAINAIDGIKNKSDYANLRIAHGKDRCANPPRSGPQGGDAGQRVGIPLRRPQRTAWVMRVRRVCLVLGIRLHVSR